MEPEEQAGNAIRLQDQGMPAATAFEQENTRLVSAIEEQERDSFNPILRDGANSRRQKHRDGIKWPAFNGKKSKIFFIMFLIFLVCLLLLNVIFF